MKLSSIECVNVRSNSSVNNNNNRKNNTKNVNFTGVSDALTTFWQFIDNGGRALQFTAEDMTGTNLPRSLKGLFNGIKYTHKLNIPAFLQEAIREFLTGPTMCIIPVVVLSIATKLSGKTANTHVENIVNLSQLLEKTPASSNIEKSFYSTVAKDMIEKTTEKTAKNEDILNIIDGIEKYKKAANKKDRKQSLTSLQDTFESIVKREKNTYDNTQFLKTKYTLPNNTTGSTNFKNYIEYTNAYIHDFMKKYGKNQDALTPENIKSFKNSWIGKRIFTFAGMFFITGILMYQIPKIYTKVSGKVNPNASVIYNEAKKQDQQQNVEERSAG